MVALQWLTSLALLALAITLLDWKELASVLLSFSPWMAVFIILLNLAEFPLMAFRWHLLSRKVVRLPFSAQLFRYCAAQFFNTFTPGQVGGDAYRFFAMRKSASTQGQLAAVIAQERLIGLAGYLAAFLIGSAVFEGSGGAASLSKPVRDALLIVEFVLFAALAVMLTLPFLLGLVERIFVWQRLRVSRLLMENVHLAARIWNANSLVAVASLTGVALFGWCLTIWLVAVDLQVAISIPAILMIGTLSELIRVIPITIQGLGLREGAFAAAFALSGHSPESGFVIGTIAYAALTVATLLIGAFGILAVRRV